LREAAFAEVAFSQARYGIIEHCIQQGNLTAHFVTTIGRLKELRWHHEIIGEPGRYCVHINGGGGVSCRYEVGLEECGVSLRLPFILVHVGSPLPVIQIS